MMLIFDTLMISLFLGRREPQARVRLHSTVLKVVKEEVRDVFTILDTVSPLKTFYILTLSLRVDT